MKFSSIILAVFGASSIVSALPAPVAAPQTGVETFEKRDIIAREAVPALQERTVTVDVVADVQVCIDAVVEINDKYNAKKSYKKADLQAWSVEVVAQIKLLIAVITAYPAGCTYPSIDVCVDIFVKLFTTIFVQLKLFLNLGGLIATLLLTVDLLLSILLGLVADLLNILVSLLVLIEAKIVVGISAKICVALYALVDIQLYVEAFVQLCVKAGLAISL